MSKSNHPRPSKRSNVAMGMIISGTGKSQVFRDKRDRRAKDARRKRQEFQYE